jgi:DNA-binding transcriptional MerR regulator
MHALDLPALWKVYNIIMKGMHIGEIAKRFDLNPRTIRYYEAIGVMPRPRRTESGYRIYSGEAAEILEFILKAKTIGFTLNEIKEILFLHEQGKTPCPHTRELVAKKIREIDRKISDLAELRTKLAGLRRLKKSSSAGAAICPIIAAPSNPS